MDRQPFHLNRFADDIFRSGWLVLLLISFSASAAEIKSLRKLSKSQQEERIASDLKAVLIYRDGLETTTKFARQQTNLFSAARQTVTNLPTREEKEVLWQTWKSYLDYLLALDALERYHRDFYFLSGERRKNAFLISYSAFLAQYRFSLDLIDAAKNNPLFDTILNEPVPEIGLSKGTFAKIKFRFLNAGTSIDFAARQALYAGMSDAASEELREKIKADANSILKMGLGQGEILSVKNALKIVQRAGDSAWLPVQTGVSEWMGDTKVYRQGRSLISSKQLDELVPKLLPGDVLLIRHEWYLSNIGLPGFWPHAALYIGTPEERQRFFDDEKMKGWVQAQNKTVGNFEDLLKSRFPSAYAKSLQPQANHPVRILEAISEGVSFTALQHAADADSLVVLRPLLPKNEKATAILRAFHYAGRPYDFNFNFATDAELVCTELVFKSYEPAKNFRGLKLPLIEMLGRPLLPANEITKQFDSQFGTDQAQFQFIVFLDGYEREGKAEEAGVEDFRQSWRRPKWHVLTQKAAKQN